MQKWRYSGADPGLESGRPTWGQLELLDSVGSGRPLKDGLDSDEWQRLQGPVLLPANNGVNETKQPDGVVGSGRTGKIARRSSVSSET